MGQKKKVLIITYNFPPRQSVGSIRYRGLAKYLPEYGWEPTILTPLLPGNPGEEFDVYETHHPGRQTELIKKRLGFDPTESVHKQITSKNRDVKSTSKTNGILSKTIGICINTAGSILAYPSNHKPWKPYAVNEGIELIKEHKFDVLISCSRPEIAHLIGSELKNKTDLPWIADLRDLWSQNHYLEHGEIRHYLERRLEQKTLSNADALVTVSQPLAERLSQLHSSETYAIPNGFDPLETIDQSLTKDFTITYTGSFYQDKRNPEPLFIAFSELIQAEELDPRNCEIRIYGPRQQWINKKISNLGLEDVVIQHGLIPREDALKKQRSSQLLLLLQWDHPEERGIYPGKLFEYLAAKRPIIAIGGPENSVVSQLLNSTGAGTHIHQVQYLKDRIRDYYQEHQKKGYVGYDADENELNKYSQQNMAKKFSILLDNVIQK